MLLRPYLTNVLGEAMKNLWIWNSYYKVTKAGCGRSEIFKADMPR